MRSLVKMLFIIAILVYGGAYAQSTLIEDWESVTTLPSANWDVSVENPSTVYPFIESAGNPGQALNPGGQGHLKSCIVYNTSFQPDYTVGMEIDFDAYLVSTGWHYTDIAIDLMKDVNAWPTSDFLVLRMQLNKNGSNERKVWMQLQSPDTLHTELMVIDGAYNSDAWNHGKIIIREDKRVEFFVNGTLLWTSTKTIDPAYSTSTTIAIGGQSYGGPARMDNLTVRNFQAGPLAYYPLNGDAADFSGNNHHGSLSGMTNFPNGVNQECLAMDGSSTHFSIPGSENWVLDERFSVAFWIRTASTGGIIVERDVIGTLTSDWHIGIETAPKLSFVFGTYDHVKTRSDVLNGTWQHLAFTREKSTGLLKIYVNGQLDTIGVSHFNTLTPGQLLRIGAWDTPGGIEGFWTGAIDEVYVYDRVLTDDEVAGLAAHGTTRIWVDSTTIQNGYVDVMMKNTYDVAAFTLPLLYHSAQPLDSIKKTGCRTENWESFHGTIYSDTTLLIGGVADFGGGTPCLPTGEGPVARIYFHSNCKDTFIACFDTTYINEPGKLLVVECGTPTVSHIPEFTASCAQYETSLPTPVANAGADLELHYCETSIRSLTAGCTDANGDVVSCELVSGPGTFDGQHINFVPNYGIYTFVVKATDACNQVDYDTSLVAVLNCGDANGNCARNVSDIVFLIDHIFSGGPAPSPLSAGDVDGSCAITISDAVYYINWIFASGPGPICVCAKGSALKQVAVSAAGNVNISTASVKSENGNEIAMFLDASSDVRAIQLDLNITGHVRNIQINSHVSDLQTFSGQVESGYRIGLIDLAGTATIPSGKAQIATISYEGDGELNISSAIVVDNDATEMNVTIANAKVESILPTEYSLSQNQPNPFNPSTDISFSLPKSGQVKLTVYNILGAEVATLVDEIRSAGVHRIIWDGTDKSGNPVASGVYLYRMTAGDFAETKKMVLMK